MLSTDDLHHISLLLDEKLAPIHQTLNEHSITLAEHTRILNEHTKILAEHTKILARHTKLHQQHTRSFKLVRKDQNMIIEVLDLEQVRLRRRIEQVEDHLHLKPPTQLY